MRCVLPLPFSGSRGNDVRLEYTWPHLQVSDRWRLMTTIVDDDRVRWNQGRTSHFCYGWQSLIHSEEGDRGLFNPMDRELFSSPDHWEDLGARLLHVDGMLILSKIRFACQGEQFPYPITFGHEIRIEDPHLMRVWQSLLILVIGDCGRSPLTVVSKRADHGVGPQSPNRPYRACNLVVVWAFITRPASHHVLNLFIFLGGGVALVQNLFGEGAWINKFFNKRPTWNLRLKFHIINTFIKNNMTHKCHHKKH